MGGRIVTKQFKTVMVFLLSLIIIIGATLFYNYRKVIFQRGNPIPYLIASVQINEKRPYVEVGANTGIYITQKGEHTLLFDFIEESQDVEFVEQAGSGYIFTNGIDNLTVSSEIYLRYFTVWTVPQENLQTK